MLERETKTICAGGAEYPLLCTFNVLEYLQNRYESIDNFQALIIRAVAVKEADGTTGSRITPVNVAAMLDGLTAMINEGIAVENETGGTDREPIRKEQAGRILRAAGISYTEAFGLVFEQLMDCVVAPKNGKTAQDQNRTDRKKKSGLILRGSYMFAQRFSIFRKKKPDT